MYLYICMSYKPLKNNSRLLCQAEFDTYIQPNIYSLERVETHSHTHHTYYVFATAKLCLITFAQNPDHDKLSTCHHTIPPIHLGQKMKINCFKYLIKKK